MAENREWLVSMSPVRNADRRVAPVGLSVPPPQRPPRVAELRRLALRR